MVARNSASASLCVCTNYQKQRNPECISKTSSKSCQDESEICCVIRLTVKFISRSMLWDYEILCYLSPLSCIAISNHFLSRYSSSARCGVVSFPVDARCRHQLQLTRLVGQEKKTNFSLINNMLHTHTHWRFYNVAIENLMWISSCTHNDNESEGGKGTKNRLKFDVDNLLRLCHPSIRRRRWRGSPTSRKWESLPSQQ